MLRRMNVQARVMPQRYFAAQIPIALFNTARLICGVQIRNSTMVSNPIHDSPAFEINTY
jgi:hypothetical protein